MKNTELQELLENRAGLKFNLKNSTGDNDMLQQTLYNNNIEDMSAFMDPKPIIDFKLSNLLSDYTANYYVNKFIKHFKKNTAFSILVDNDADGFSSAALLGKYLNNFTDKVKYIFSEGKTHGLSDQVMEELKSNKPEFLIIPDAASNDYDQLIELTTENNVECLVIDHHDFNNEKQVSNKFMPIISNQYSNNDGSINRNFTGVGMVYMFVKSIDEIMKTNYSDDLLYYFSVGQVGDVSDVSDLEIRYLMLKGFKQIKNNELLSLNVDTDNLSAHELSFSIIPKINAVCRTGSIDDKANLMKSLSDSVSHDRKFELKTRKKSKEDGKFHQIIKQVSFAELETRSLNSIQAKQKRSINNAMKKLVNIRETNKLAVVIDEDNVVNKTGAGLLATKIASKLQKPTLVLHPDSENFLLFGSGRGVSKVMPDFREYCLSTKMFEFATGHGNAFGVSISRDNLEKILDDDSTVNQTITYDVDCCYLNSTPSIREILNFDNYRSLFGGEVKEPKIAIIGLEIPTNTIRFRGSMLTFKKSGISFAMFSCPDEVKNNFELSGSRNITIDVYGEPTVNRYMKDEFPQIIISDIKQSEPLNNNMNTDDDLIFDF